MKMVNERSQKPLWKKKNKEVYKFSFKYSDGLIYKLIKINLPEFIICWTIEFLINRSFAVRVNNWITDRLIISVGVPQGAVL